MRGTWPGGCLLAALAVLGAIVPTTAHAAPEVQLVDGKFGKALDASRTPLAFNGDQRYRTPPLTIECWAKLNSNRDFNVLVSCDPKTSSNHWEIYSVARSGNFSAYLPGYEPSEIQSKTQICDKQWHYLAATFDGKQVRLFVDGKQVLEKAVKPRNGVKAVPGPLSIGQSIAGSTRVGCDGAIDDVRISRVLRKIEGVPKAPLPVDPQTIGVWRFDDGDKILADPAWTPPPRTTGEAWERMTDSDWVDARLRKMDTGPTFNATMSYLHKKKRVMVYKATAIRIGDKGEGTVMFDRNQLRMAAGWTGGFLNHSDKRFGLLNTPTPAGTMVFSSPSAPGWANAKSKWESRWKSTQPATAPLPREWGRFNGLYLHGKRTVLSYVIDGVEVLESPWLETIDGQTVLVRHFEIGPTKRLLEVVAGDIFSRTRRAGMSSGETMISGGKEGNRESIVAVVGDVTGKDEKGQRWAKDFQMDAGTNLVLHLLPDDRVRRFRVYYWAGPDKHTAAIEKAIWKLPAKGPDVRAWTKPGPARWTKELTTRGEIAKDVAPYVVDTLTIPYDNPYNALFFCTGLDFLPDGRIALCTAHGDVWLVKADAKLEKIAWKRFATGLYQPLGLKVVEGKIVVLERGQLTRLHDLDGDGEADWYENLCNDWHTGSGEHSYDTCLETDPAGNFYFFKTGDTNLPQGGCLLWASKDGKKLEVFATGFRHPIGLSVSPTGVVTGADQEGNWMPVTRVDLYKRGGFYGDMRAHHRSIAPKIYDQPLLWLPKNVDNSAGGQVWVPHDRFGLPKGQLLHLSYGRCKMYAILTQQIGDVQQGFAADMGVLFLSGAMRARFHPTDGQLYVCGLNGWQTAARRDGCLQRVRYTGQPLPFPTSIAVRADGIRLGFARKLGAKSAEAARYQVEMWNYRWSGDYGSKNWSVSQPKREGKDTLKVEQATLNADGKSITLKITGLVPVMQLRISYDVLTDDSKKLTGAVYGTIHKLAKALERQSE